VGIARDLGTTLRKEVEDINARAGKREREAFSISVLTTLAGNPLEEYKLDTDCLDNTIEEDHH
jgi:hypothetical protein